MNVDVNNDLFFVPYYQRQISLYDECNDPSLKKRAERKYGVHIELILNTLNTIDLITTSMVSTTYYRCSIELIRKRITPLQDRHLLRIQSLTDKIMKLESVFGELNNCFPDVKTKSNKKVFKKFLEIPNHHPRFELLSKR